MEKMEVKYAPQTQSLWMFTNERPKNLKIDQKDI
jgi:hypothetical protein